jgi:hypothetical protein
VAALIEPDAWVRIGRPLDRLAARAPIAAAAARRALAAVLAPVAASKWPEVAWRASALTDDGFPAEFAWSSRDASVRWTAEVAAPETPQAERLELARKALQALLGAAGPAGLEPLSHGWAQAQPHDLLRFGAWIGGRHGASGDRYKIYIERPQLARDAARQLSDLEEALSRRVVWRMAGAETPGTGFEVYGRTEQQTLAGMRRALQWAGLECFPQIEAALQALCWRPAGERPLGKTSGISVSFDKNGPAALTWFAPARAAGRSTAEVASAVRAAAALCGGDTGLLDALLDDPVHPLGKIGMVGLGAARDGTTWIQASWRPEELALCEPA